MDELTFGMDKLRKIRSDHWKERLKSSKIAKSLIKESCITETKNSVNGL